MFIKNLQRGQYTETKTDKEIAELFSCSRATVNQIKNNKIWKEV